MGGVPIAAQDDFHCGHVCQKFGSANMWRECAKWDAIVLNIQRMERDYHSHGHEVPIQGQVRGNTRSGSPSCLSQVLRLIDTPQAGLSRWTAHNIDLTWAIWLGLPVAVGGHESSSARPIQFWIWQRDCWSILDLPSNNHQTNQDKKNYLISIS